MRLQSRVAADRGAGADGRRGAGLLPAGRRGGDADRLLPRQPDPRRGLAAVHGARRAVDRDRHARAGGARTARPGPLRLLDVRALGLPRALPRRARRRPAQARRPRLGRPGADRRPAAAGAGREAGRRSTRCRCCPATAGTGSPSSGAAGRSARSLNATTTRSALALLLRQARGDRSPMPPEFVDMIWEHWDRGTGRGDPRPLPPRRPRPARRGRAATSAGSPAPRSSSGASATPTSRRSSPRPTPTRCPTPSWTSSPGAGHWPWIDDARVIDRVARFPRLSARPVSAPLTRRLQLPDDAGLCNAVGSRLPKGWGDLGRQIGHPRLGRPRLRRSCAASPTAERAVAMAHGQQVIDFERVDRHPLRARPAGVLPAGAAG